MEIPKGPRRLPPYSHTPETEEKHAGPLTGRVKQLQYDPNTLEVIPRLSISVSSEPKPIKATISPTSSTASKVDELLTTTSSGAKKALESRDPHKLLKEIGKNHNDYDTRNEQWEINFGLLHSTYNRAKDPDIKEKIRFLMVNYLQKAAFLNYDVSFFSNDYLQNEDYTDMLQLGHTSISGHYHRVAQSEIRLLDALNIMPNLGSIRDFNNLIPVDTVSAKDVLNTAFSVIQGTSETEITEQIISAFERQMHNFPQENLSKPLIFDASSIIGDNLITDTDRDKIDKYENLKKEALDKFYSQIQIAAKMIKTKYPEISQTKEQIQNYLGANSGFITSTSITEDISVIASFEILTRNPDNNIQNEFITKLDQWSKVSGVGTGGVKYREALAKHKDPEGIANTGNKGFVEYVVEGKILTNIYKTKNEFTDANVFKLLSKIGMDKKAYGKGQALLADGTIKMTKTLFDHISQTNWENIQDDPAIAELIQTSLFRAQQHLSTAILNVSDFRVFTQALDCYHTELTTLLYLLKPFKPGTFEKNYHEFISPLIPSTAHLKIGLSKSAMSVYTGVASTILKDNPDANIVLEKHSYYEEAMVTGDTPTLKDALSDPAITKIDLFTTEFYHNIDADITHSHYKKVDVAKRIKDIFHKKPETDSLTVAIDATIDFAESKDIKKLFKTFKAEIEEGRLNLVVLRSGQKFDMFGFDNYFGAPFYVVNNGNKKWDNFNTLFDSETFKTDELTHQYFGLASSTGMELTDQYKSRIFKNTRAILDKVPLSLRPGMNKKVFIATSAANNLSPFIEFTPISDDQNENLDLFLWIQEQTMDIFNSNKKLMYNRGSFGFAMPNMSAIGEEKIRINPGIDPSDSKLFEKLFRRIDKKIAES